MMRSFTGNAAEWDARIAKLANPHLLQTWEWAQVKEAYGWKQIPLIWDHAAAMVLRRQVLGRGLAARLCILYVPKGPLFETDEPSIQGPVLDDLQGFARGQRAILLKIDPDVRLGSGIPGQPEAREEEAGISFQSRLLGRGWVSSESQVQFRNTVLIDLRRSEMEMLEQMKQKTRYNIRLAEKKGVYVRAGTLADLPALYRMYAATSVRDGFVIRNETYYRTVWQAFMSAGPSGASPWAEPLIAEVDGEA